MKLPSLARSARLWWLSLLLVVFDAVAAHAGPPWISIEYPVNPFDAATRGALVVVRTYHHGVPVPFPVEAVATGRVDGERRTLPLRVVRTSQPGVWAVRGELPAGTPWVVEATLSTEGTTASALVAMDSRGELAAIVVPFDRQEGFPIPRAARTDEIDRLLARARRISGDGEAVGRAPVRKGRELPVPAGVALLLGLPLSGLCLARRRKGADRTAGGDA